MTAPEDQHVWRHIGNHRLREMDGIAVVECDGEIHLADAQQMTAFFDAVIAKTGIFLLLLVLSKDSRPREAARKHLVTWTGKRKGATACVGGSMTLHVVAALLNRAVRVLHGNAMPMEMFRQQAPAIAWLREHERKLREKQVGA